VLPDDGFFSHRNMQELFNVNCNAKLKSFLRLSNCASVGEKTLTINKQYISSIQCIYTLHMIHKTATFSPVHNSPTGFSNRSTLFSVRYELNFY
jgi:hypothetical protein